MRLSGVELGAVPGLSASLVPPLISELGTAMHQFPTGKPFCAWRDLAPHNDRSGSSVFASTLKVVKRAAQAVRQASRSVTGSASACGAYVRAMGARLGPPQAMVATAHKLAQVVDHLLQPREAVNAASAAE